MTRAASYVLVHGSGQNASCWSAVRSLLEERGHEVVCPELEKKAADATLEDHARTIAQHVTRDDAIIVAHSFSGAFLPLVSKIRACGALVYFAAVIPEPGKSVREQFVEDDSMFGRGWIEAGARWFDPAEQEGIAREFLFHDCDEAEIPALLQTLEMMDTRPLVTLPCPLAKMPGLPTTSIVATRDRTISPAWGRRVTRELLGIEPIEIDAGHCPQNSRPVETADLLESVLG